MNMPTQIYNFLDKIEQAAKDLALSASEKLTEELKSKKQVEITNNTLVTTTITESVKTEKQETEIKKEMLETKNTLNTALNLVKNYGHYGFTLVDITYPIMHNLKNKIIANNHNQTLINRIFYVLYIFVLLIGSGNSYLNYQAVQQDKKSKKEAILMLPFSNSLISFGILQFINHEYETEFITNALKDTIWQVVFRKDEWDSTEKELQDASLLKSIKQDSNTSINLSITENENNKNNNESFGDFVGAKDENTIVNTNSQDYLNQNNNEKTNKSTENKFPTPRGTNNSISLIEKVKGTIIKKVKCFQTH